MMNLFTRFDPALREQIVAIDGKRDPLGAEAFAELESQREQAAASGLLPHYVRPMEGSALNPSHAPYAVRPAWNPERRTLDLVFLSARHGFNETSPEEARYTLPPHVYAIALRHHQESVVESLKAQFAGTAPGGVIRARNVGAESIRDWLREQGVEVSLSFAAALFTAITKLHTQA